MISGYDDTIKFHIVNAPIAKVLPLCVGFIRAENQGAILTRGVTEPPARYHSTRIMQPDFYDYLPGVLISTPEGRPDLTLIECPHSFSLDYRIEMIDPSLSSLTIWSHIESQRIQYHGFELRQNAKRVRLAAIEKGVETNRWEWRQDGPILPFEEPLAYNQRSIPKRLTPSILANYASANGVDPKRHLIGRKLENTVLITFGQVMNANDSRLRTTEFQETYERVLELGIGEREPTEAQHASAREKCAKVAMQIKLKNKASRAFYRLNAKSDVTVAQVVAWFDRYQKLLQDAFGPDADPSPLDIWAADKATAIDPVHPDSEWLRGNKESWENIRNVQYRLVRILPEDQSYTWQIDAQILQLIRSVLKENKTPEKELTEEVLRRFRKFCESQGIIVEPDAHLPSTALAKAAAFAALVNTRRNKFSSSD